MVEAALTETELFLERVSGIAQEFSSLAISEVIVLHHNDCDGLSSAAILTAALMRADIRHRSYCLEKPYPKVLRALFDDPFLDEKAVFLFADFASGMLPVLATTNSARHPIFILDHHSIEGSRDSSIRLVNCREFGISGNTECSASTVCYFFARALASYNRDLARFAVAGAVGDGQIDTGGCLSGLNALAAKDAVEAGVLQQGPELLLEVGELIRASDLKRDLDALGSFGYFKGGPDVAIKGLLDGFDVRYRERAATLRRGYESALNTFLRSLQLQSTRTVDWFVLPDSFSAMGVKTVGLVCEAVLEAGKGHPEKVLAGFQEIPGAVPGLGRFDFGEWKVSLRVPEKVRGLMEAGNIPPLHDVLPRAVHRLDGFVDACHLHAAAATVPKGREGQLIETLDQMFGERWYEEGE